MGSRVTARTHKRGCSLITACVSLPLMSAGITHVHVGKRLLTTGVDALLSTPTISFLETGMSLYRVCLCLCLLQKGILLEWATNVVHLIMLSFIPP